MNNAKFILSKKILLEQVKKLEDLKLKISYSYKTNNQVGQILQEISDVNFSIHAKPEINFIQDKSKIWFFTQAESEKELTEMLNIGINKFVVDNKKDLEIILNSIKETNTKISLSLRMKFQENRVGTGKYFVYGMPSKKVNELISELKNNPLIKELGVHIHRKSQNTSEWEIKQELEDSLTKETLETINFLNLGGGLPTKYRSYTTEVIKYIFEKLENAKEFLSQNNIQTYIEPGRFLASPCIKLETEIIQVQNNNLIINTSIYQCALDSILTGTKMLVESEIPDNKEEKESNFYLIKGNSPTRDDIFRYKVKLKNPKIGDKIIFLNAGAYNYTTDFFGYNKLKTEIIE
jgi:ornithine decarboxylase